MNTEAVRVFPGHATRQVTTIGRPADAEKFYFEPADYDGDVLFSMSYTTETDALAAARRWLVESAAFAAA